MKCSV